jgi:hypothetical protein
MIDIDFPIRCNLVLLHIPTYKHTQEGKIMLHLLGYLKAINRGFGFGDFSVYLESPSSIDSLSAFADVHMFEEFSVPQLFRTDIDTQARVCYYCCPSLSFTFCAIRLSKLPTSFIKKPKTLALRGFNDEVGVVLFKKKNQKH